MKTNQKNSVPCPFCAPELRRVRHADDIGFVMSDGFPISPGHSLIIPKDHYPTIFDVPHEKQIHLFSLVRKAKEIICDTYSPDGFNIGINNGEAAGQTVPHVHIHVIPRYEGDVEDPRGGVRWVIPEKAKYWS